MISIQPWAPLLVASYTGDSETVEKLLDAKGDPNEVDELGRTALIHAASQGHSKVVAALIKLGTDVAFSPSTDERTALHWAAFHGHKECCDLLQSAGCELVDTDSQGLTPQDLAVLGGAPFILLPGDRSAASEVAAGLRVQRRDNEFQIVAPPPAPPPEVDEASEVPVASAKGRRGSVIARAEQAAMLASSIKVTAAEGAKTGSTKSTSSPLASRKAASSKPGSPDRSSRAKFASSNPAPVTTSTFGAGMAGGGGARRAATSSRKK